MTLRISFPSVVMGRKYLTRFDNSDNLRDHYPDCSQRGDRQIPETGQRGRRRHACESVGGKPSTIVTVSCHQIRLTSHTVYFDETAV